MKEAMKYIDRDGASYLKTCICTKQLIKRKRKGDEMDRERKKETDSEGEKERATDIYFHPGTDSIVLISEA